MLELSLNQVMKHVGTTLLLKDVNVSIYEKDRVGIVGANGSGKSTLLKLIAGIEPLNVYPGSWSKGYDYGFISRPAFATFAYLDQLPEYAESTTVQEVLQSAFSKIFEVEAAMRRFEEILQNPQLDEETLEITLKKYDRLLQEFEQMGGYSMQEKFSKICSGLKIDEAFLQEHYECLSGGEKTTIELGRQLMNKPEFLLLDEPTNHLDVESVEWLEAYLRQYEGTVILVSHDRYFLDGICNKILEIEHLTTKMYSGNYSCYVYQKEEALRIQEAQYLEQQKQLDKMEKSIQHLRQWALAADNNKFFRRAASMQIKMSKIERIQRPVFEKPNMRLSFKGESRTGKETILLDQVSKSFGEQTLMDQVSVKISYGERVALTGKNGCGKTTLIKMLLGEVEADAGRVQMATSAKVGYLPQVIHFKDDSMTVLECFRDDVELLEGACREYLAKFMFYGKRVYTEVSKLSGGERVRLMLAKILYKEVNVLILDEPTNHLDIDSIETLEEALSGFKGTILFISHDRYFVHKLSTRILALKDGQLFDFEGDYEHYKNAIISA